MYLVTAATDFEMEPFRASCRTDAVEMLVTGIGPVEAAVRLSSWLGKHGDGVSGVVNIGVAGAYIQPDPDRTPGLLDICLAEQEVFGDLGICLEDRIEGLSGSELKVENTIHLDNALREEAISCLRLNRVLFFSGTFVTVSCASGTSARGNMLARQHRALAENMEGAAVARVCREFDLPCLELRCISNLVEDRDTTRWQLKKACRRAGEVAALVLEKLCSRALSGPEDSA